MNLMLPYVLRHENIALLENDKLYIGDRRCYPFERKRIEVSDYKGAAKAIRDMVTQGGGSLEVALMAMLLTYRKDRESLHLAQKELSGARRTNTTTGRSLAALMMRYENGEDFELVVNDIIDTFDRRYDRLSDIGETLVKDGSGVLTTCFPEHTFMLSMAKAKRNGKHFSVYVPETRPYFQGTHLTEPSLRELGIEVYLITDGMPAHFLSEGKIGVYMTASDLALKDRTIVNKTGTLANAIASRYYGVPYYAFSMGLDLSKTIDDIDMEYRSGEEIKSYRGISFAGSFAKALYPCFDIISSELVTGIVTEEGIL